MTGGKNVRMKKGRKKIQKNGEKTVKEAMAPTSQLQKGCFWSNTEGGGGTREEP